MNKSKIGVIFGGRSGEHEVSLVSASSVIKALDTNKFEVIEIGITKEGRWYVGPDCLQAFRQGNYEGLTALSLSTDGLIAEGLPAIKIDVFFPVLHGPFGEDGTIQGLFEMMNVAYVGCGVLASSTAMDKLQCKAIWEAAGLPVVPYLGFTRAVWESDSEAILLRIEGQIGFPCFVKPANMGSSVGISKVKNAGELVEAVDLAAKYDRKILVENGLDVREIECAVLGNEDAIPCMLGEIIVGGEFYDFNDKYVDGKSSTEVPADIPANVEAKVKEICLMAFKSLDCSGLARVDCFIDRDSGKMFLNELNTMPGFTSISMYPKMVQAYGLSYEELVERLIELGMERFADKERNQVVFDSGSDWFKE